MNLKAARYLSLMLMLAAFPLISVGTTRNRPALWWLGLACLGIGALIPPVLRYVPASTKEEPHKQSTDLGDSSRVC